MSESLPLVVPIVQPVTSLEPGTNTNDIVKWNGLNWAITNITHNTSPFGIKVYYVNPLNAIDTSTYSTISSAILSAETDIGSATDYQNPIILISPGTYIEDIVINKKVHLKGVSSTIETNTSSVIIKMATAPMDIRSGFIMENIILTRVISNGTSSMMTMQLSTANFATIDNTSNPNTIINCINCVINGSGSTSTDYTIDLSGNHTSSIDVRFDRCRITSNVNCINVADNCKLSLTNCKASKGQIYISSAGSSDPGNITVSINLTEWTGTIITAGALLLLPATSLEIKNSSIYTPGNASSIVLGQGHGNAHISNTHFYSSSTLLPLISVTVASATLSYGNLIFNPYNAVGTLNDIINLNATGSILVAMDVIPTIIP